MMTEEDYTLIRISKLSKKKLDNLKIIEGEPYYSIFDELIDFGEEYNFKRIRAEKLAKKMDDKDERKIKVKQRASAQIE